MMVSFQGKDGLRHALLLGVMLTSLACATPVDSSAGPSVDSSANPLADPSVCPVLPVPPADSKLIEVRIPSLNMISSQGTLYSTTVLKADMLPRGAALWTPSGALKKNQKIERIIHAAPGASAQSKGPLFAPSLEGVRLAVRNSMVLAAQKHKKVAIPFIGGKIFKQSIGVSSDKLAEEIIRSALESRGPLQLQFVLFTSKEEKLFRDTFEKLLLEDEFKNARACANFFTGDITKFSVHGAPVIVNAANMEVQFGGGISGAIGRAAAEPRIDLHAKNKILKFNAEMKKLVQGQDIQN